jgi:hypothetical protein
LVCGIPLIRAARGSGIETPVIEMPTMGPFPRIPRDDVYVQPVIGSRRRYDLQRLMGDVLLTGRTIRATTRGERRQKCEELVARVRTNLEPHAAEDEPGLEAVQIWLRALAETNPSDVDRLQELLYGIDALVRVHIWRETDIALEPPEPTVLEL